MADETGTGGGMGDPVKTATDALRGAGTKVAENGSALSLTVLEQAEQNTREAFAAMRAAASAKSMADLMKVQGDYVREQSSRSVDQARKIGELITRFGREMMTPPGSETK